MRYVALALLVVGCGGASPDSFGHPVTTLTVARTVPPHSAELVEREPCRVADGAVIYSVTGHGHGGVVRLGIDRVLRYMNADPHTAVYDPPLDIGGPLYLDADVENSGNSPLRVEISVDIETNIPIECE